MSVIPALLPSPSRRQRVTTDTRALWHLAWPILIGQLANIGMAVVDVAMAGHASADDLAGISLGVSIWNMVIITINNQMCYYSMSQQTTLMPSLYCG